MKKKEVDDWMRWLSERGALKTLESVLDEEAGRTGNPKKGEKA
jgi:hypothetical protein